jgi:hypothetical protein
LSANSRREQRIPLQVCGLPVVVTGDPQRTHEHVTWTPPGGKPTDVTPLLQIDDGRPLNQLSVWAPDAAIRPTILVDNPARLYEF